MQEWLLRHCFGDLGKCICNVEEKPRYVLRRVAKGSLYIYCSANSLDQLQMAFGEFMDDICYLKMCELQSFYLQLRLSFNSISPVTY